MHDGALEQLAVRAAGVDVRRDRATVEVLGRGLLAGTVGISTPDSERVVKLCSPEIVSLLRQSSDPRVDAFGRLFPIAPLFSRLVTWLDAARSVAPVAVPEALGQGVLDGRVPFVVMTRLPGHRWRPAAWRSAAERRRGSLAMGELARRLHGSSLAAAGSRSAAMDLWLDQVGDLLFWVADRVLAMDPRRAGAAGNLHQRVHAILDQARSTPLGDHVVVHGDLHPANLLFDSRGDISGLIDFELTCRGPAALDFRHLAALDADSFLSGYGRYEGSNDQACWLGHFMDLLWQGIGLGVRSWICGGGVPLGLRRQMVQFEYLLQLCENGALRRGSPLRRRLRRFSIGVGADLARVRRRLRRRPQVEHDVGFAEASATQVAVIVPTWNRFETTTGPCLRSLLWFTSLRYRVIFVDNGSTDETRAQLSQRAERDPRIELVVSEENLGWAGGSLKGLACLRPEDTHVLLLNSDTLVTPAWLSKLVAHLASQPPSTIVIPNEYPDQVGALGPVAPEEPIEPGSLVAAPPPGLGPVLQLSSLVEQQQRGRTRSATPSGFCALFGVGVVAAVRDYLRDFDRFHAGELDPHAAWKAAGLRCLVALDTFIFHARGGSGGYYRYDRRRAL